MLNLKSDNIFQATLSSLNKINVNMQELKHVEEGLNNEIINLTKLLSKTEEDLSKISPQIQ